MRHGKLNKRFGRFGSARQALIRDLAQATLSYESITTTKIRAKEARKLVERLISLGKEGSLNSRRLAYKELCDHSLVGLLFNDIALRFKNISGGYTRIYSLLQRRGDGAEQVVLELTEKKKKEKTPKVKAEKKETAKRDKLLSPEELKEEEPFKENEAEKEVGQKKAAFEEAKKAEGHVEDKEKPKAEEKSAPPVKAKSKHKETKPPKIFLGGLRKFFKKERDSL